MAQRIGEILAGTLLATTEAEIDDALEIQRAEGGARRIGQILLERGMDREKLLEGLGLQFGLPTLGGDEFPAEPNLRADISHDFLREHLIFPLSAEGGILTVATANPMNGEALAKLAAALGLRIELRIALEDDIARNLDEAFGSRDAVMQRILGDVEEEQGPSESGEGGEISHLKDLAEDRGIIQLVGVLIENAVKDRASDIHIEPYETQVKARYRIDGVLYDAQTLPKRTQSAVASRIKLMAQMNIAERRLPQDGRIRGRFASREVDIRVSTLPTVYGESIVMRLLDTQSAFLPLEDIGFTEDLLAVYRRLIEVPYGMFLITGPTGSGKTTTLYATLDKINSPDKKIITVEEPVEYLLQGINQMAVRSKIGLSFASGLRHIVRQDPDIIMVGEIRDRETAEIAIHAALTGHLLFSTLHTNDAPGATTRMMDMGVENYLVASTLIGVMAQRLVRRICPSCKEEVPVGADIAGELPDGVAALFQGRGCDECNHTGYRGRLAIFELMPVDDVARSLVMRRATARELKEAAVAAGMRTLREDGIRKAVRGLTTLGEVLRVTQVGL